VIGGADSVVLCDTNGGTLPWEIAEIVETIREDLLGHDESKKPPAARITFGIHAHNDGGTGVANTLQAVRSGCNHVQGTINGYGERCGNADLVSVIADLQLKMGYELVSPEGLQGLADLSHYVSELANLNPDSHQPFVGLSAFAHKGGTHVNAVVKNVMSYQHIDPAAVGNQTRVLVSELSGKDNIAVKRREFGLEGLTPEEERKILTRIKELENAGFAFESAEASVELMLRRSRAGYAPPFELIDYTANVEHRQGRGMFSEATLKVKINGQTYHEVSDGNGPVNALDGALRKALQRVYPSIHKIQLKDYKVRILDSNSATAAKVRVLIDSTDGERIWSTVGASSNIIEASWRALADSVEFFLLYDDESDYDGGVKKAAMAVLS
jgi:2-isopropylmalate synthase